VDGARLLVADADNHQVRAIDLLTRQVTVLAGDGAQGSGGDGGPATAAQLNQPYGVTVAPDGAVYVADFGDNRVRRIGPDGVISTVAGTGEAAFSGDGGPAVDAALSGPADVLLGPDGALYIADMVNGVVRRVAP
jgi:serine/threonine-protein kinase